MSERKDSNVVPVGRVDHYAAIHAAIHAAHDAAIRAAIHAAIRAAHETYDAAIHAAR